MDPVEIARRLIAIPSVNPMGRMPAESGSSPPAIEQGVTAFLAGFLAERDIDFEIQNVADGRANVIAMIPGQDADQVILLDAHQDTVPVEQMTISPFEAEVVGERLTGRGACDVKGGMAAILAALDRVRSSRGKPPVSILASFTCDEEHQQLGAQRLVSGWRAGSRSTGLAARKPSLAVITEPTDLDVVVAHRGVVRWSLTTRGRAAHSSRPEEGTNAIYRMAAVVRCLQDYAARLGTRVKPHPRCGPATLSVGVIAGGASVNMVPDCCTIEIDRRLLPGESAAVAQADVARVLSETLDFPVEASEPWCLSDPLIDNDNHELAERLGGLAARLAGKGRAIGVSYGTHAPRFAAAGIPTVVFGPGSIAQAHTEDEWIEIRQLRAAAEILTEFCFP